MTQKPIPIQPASRGFFFRSKFFKESTMTDTTKTKAVKEAPLTASQVQLNLNDTSTNNQHQIILSALRERPQSTIELRHVYGIMMPAARIKELRGMGYRIDTVRVVEYTPDNIKHHAVAKYVQRGVSHE